MDNRAEAKRWQERAEQLEEELREAKSYVDALCRSESRLAEAYRIAGLGHWEWDIPSGGLFWSEGIFALFGLDPDGFTPTYEAFLERVHPDDRVAVEKGVKRSLEGRPYSMDHRIVRPDGAEKTVHEQAEVSFDESGRPLRMLGTVQDITERLQAEARVRQAEEHYRVLFEQMPDAVMVLDPESKVPLAFNELAPRMLGYSKEEFSRLPMTIHEVQESSLEVDRHAQQILSDGRDDFETRLRRKDGGVLDIRVIARAFELEGRPMVQSILRDISQSKRDEKRLLRSLEEKDLLLRELHHRVKNNLQVVSSLLYLQSRKTDDAKVQQLFLDSRDRLRSMALLHELFYEAKDLVSLDYGGYLRRVLDGLAASADERDVRLDLEIGEERHKLDFDGALHCGLIVNELVTNAIRHAFPDRRTGRVIVRLDREDENFCLSVEDDGIGFPEDRASSEVGLGLTIVQALTAQLEGRFHLTSSEEGSCVRVLFPDEHR